MDTIARCVSIWLSFIQLCSYWNEYIIALILIVKTSSSMWVHGLPGLTYLCLLFFFSSRGASNCRFIPRQTPIATSTRLEKTDHPWCVYLCYSANQIKKDQTVFSHVKLWLGQIEQVFFTKRSSTVSYEYLSHDNTISPLALRLQFYVLPRTYTLSPLAFIVLSKTLKIIKNFKVHT